MDDLDGHSIMISFGDNSFSWWRMWDYALSIGSALFLFAMTAGLAFAGYWVMFG